MMLPGARKGSGRSMGGVNRRKSTTSSLVRGRVWAVGKVEKKTKLAHPSQYPAWEACAARSRRTQ